MGGDSSDRRKLFIRLPVRIKEELQIKELHPNIIKVHLPRQKSRRWCIVEFENKAKQQEAIVALKKVKINNKSIKIKPYKKQNKSANIQKRVGEVEGRLLKLLKEISKN